MKPIGRDSVPVYFALQNRTGQVTRPQGFSNDARIAAVSKRWGRGYNPRPTGDNLHVLFRA